MEKGRRRGKMGAFMKANGKMTVRMGKELLRMQTEVFISEHGRMTRQKVLVHLSVLMERSIVDNGKTIISTDMEKYVHVNTYDRKLGAIRRFLKDFITTGRSTEKVCINGTTAPHIMANGMLTR